MQKKGCPGLQLERDALEFLVHPGGDRGRAVRLGDTPGGTQQIEQRQIRHGVAIRLAAALQVGYRRRGALLAEGVEETRLANAKLANKSDNLTLPLLHPDEASV